MSTSTDPRVDALIELLLRRTRDGHLKWQPTADEDTFRLASTTANVRLTRSEAFEQDGPQVRFSRQLSILNDRARVVEEYFPVGFDDENRFDMLFAEARRSAHNTDDVLDKLMRELQQGTS